MTNTQRNTLEYSNMAGIDACLKNLAEKALELADSHYTELDLKDFMTVMAMAMDDLRMHTYAFEIIKNIKEDNKQ